MPICGDCPKHSRGKPREEYRRTLHTGLGFPRASRLAVLLGACGHEGQPEARGQSKKSFEFAGVFNYLTFIILYGENFHKNDST